MIAIFFIISLFLAVNMGVSGFSVSFAPSYGSGVLTKRKAVILYALCVFLGGMLIGPRVCETLVKKMSYIQFSPLSGGIILAACTVTMFLSNLLRVPQSTSFVTVSSFIGAGLYYGKLNWHTVLKIFAFALIFSCLSFIIAVMVKRRFYPPHQKNIRIYEKFFILFRRTQG